MSGINDLFYELLRVAIGTQDILSRQPSQKEWAALYDMVTKQSLLGICFAGVQKICDSDAEDYFGMSEFQYLSWMGMAATIQQQNEHHELLISRLSKFYEQEGIGLMLLKGQGIAALYRPVGEDIGLKDDAFSLGSMRNPGDVDVFLFNISRFDEPAWKRGDKAVSEKLGLKVRNDSEHHTRFVMDGISVENHYDFVNTRIRRSSKRLEQVFKSLAEDHSNWMEMDGQRVYLPSDKLNSLFLLRHCAGHFAAEGITMKNVLDWGFFICGAGDIDWDWLWNEAKEYNMHRFLMCLNAICVEGLGMDGSNFDQRYYDKALKERVLEEIMKGTDIVSDASAWQRTKRWWQHRWKHKICYSDSMLSSFVYSVKANLLGTSAE